MQQLIVVPLKGKKERNMSNLLKVRAGLNIKAKNETIK